MRQVRDRLYIGNITDANSVIQSADLQVTHVLSLLSNQLPYQQKLTQLKPGDIYSVVTMRAGVHYLPPGLESSQGEEAEEDPENLPGREFIRMMMPLRDLEYENLLDRLEPCLDFIEEGRKMGDVLVHCLAGISRSASVVTAYLMRTEKLSLDDALSSLREASQGVCPNEGFMEQLKMFEEMGFKVDQESAIYKQFHLSCLASTGGTTNMRRQSFTNQIHNVVGSTNRVKQSSPMTHQDVGDRKENTMEKGNNLKGPDSPPIRVRIARLWQKVLSHRCSFKKNTEWQSCIAAKDVGNW